MKPIEAGCLAIVINANYPGNIGKEVKVIYLDHMETLKMAHKVWFVESTNGPLVVRTNDHDMESEENMGGLVLERNLMRIDGGEPKDMIDKRINFLEVDKCQRNYRRVL